MDWNESLEQYQVIVAPSLYLMNEQVAEQLEHFTRQGGTLILTSRSGVKNMDNQCVMRPLPGLLSTCAGVIVEEYDPIGGDEHHITSKEGTTYSCSQWCDILIPVEAEVISWYADDFFSGKAAVTLNHFGKGQVYYLGTHADENYLRDLFIDIAEKQGISFYPDLPEGVQITARSGEGGSYLFLLNLSRDSQKVTLPASYTSALYDVLRSEKIELEPYGVEILEVDR
ncbi:Beta-galactosidase BgaA [compost metagenome]